MGLMNTLLQMPGNLYRRATCHSRRLPDFMIIGAQKSGTTAMFSYLSQHPGLSIDKKRATHFFDINYTKGMCYYKSSFPLIRDSKDKLVGEYTPFYLFHPLAVERISQHLPNVKIIVLLRNPVNRAYSHFNMKMEKGHDTETFEEALALEESRLAGEVDKIRKDGSYNSWNFRAYAYKSRGMYADQLERVYKYFKKEQVLVLSSETFFKNHLEAMKEIYDFLGISFFEPKDLHIRNKREYPVPLSEKTRKELSDFFRPHNERLFEMIGKRFNWND